MNEICEYCCQYELQDYCECDKYPLDHGACPVCMEEEEDE